MRAGLLDRVITLSRSTRTVDANGNPQDSWAAYASPRAQLLQMSTDEFMRTGLGADTHLAAAFQIRWLDGVTLADRVTYNGTAYRIQDIKEIGRREALELRCLAVSA